MIPLIGLFCIHGCHSHLTLMVSQIREHLFPLPYTWYEALSQVLNSEFMEENDFDVETGDQLNCPSMAANSRFL